ncbi:MAG: hypothetical protein MUC51_01700 [Anaerolineae bacterium]|jgi:hypothetical protein|nr:hypothetical protein [Anaerolineae bacterium]
MYRYPGLAAALAGLVLRVMADASRNVLAGQIGVEESRVDIARLRLEELKAGPRREDVAGRMCRLPRFKPVCRPPWANVLSLRLR